MKGRVVKFKVILGGKRMEWLKRMNDALSYLEDNLDEHIDYPKLAKIACTSVYNFQRMFSFITDVSLSEYIRRRRLTLAAFELQNSSIKVIDLALKYGYESPEAFTRAFLNVHGVTPTLARNKGVQLKAYPRLSFHISIKGDVEMNYKIEQKDAFTVFGVEGIFTTENGENLKTIPKFWYDEFHKGTLDKIIKATGEDWNNRYGLAPVNSICDYGEQEEVHFRICYVHLKHLKVLQKATQKLMCQLQLGPYLLQKNTHKRKQAVLFKV